MAQAPPGPQDPGPRTKDLGPMASWPSLPTGRAAKDDIVMIPARWRCEISEALAPGQQPGHSQSTSPPTASAGLSLSVALPLRCRSPPSHARRGHSQKVATDDLCHLATSPPSPSLSACGRHCRSTSNEASTPSPGRLRCGCYESASLCQSARIRDSSLLHRS